MVICTLYINPKEGIMKNKALYLLGLFISIMAISSGCALVTPPPYVSSQTEIIKNDQGRVVSSRYTRSVRGFTYNDPETAASWAFADQQSRTDTEGETGSPFDSKLGEVINERYSLRKAEIYPTGSDQPVVEVLLDSNEKKEISLPYGEYKTLWVYKNKAKWGSKFYVRPQKTVYYDGRKMGWVQYIQ